MKPRCPTVCFCLCLAGCASIFSESNYPVRIDTQPPGASVSILARSIDGWYIANVLFGGVIGLLIVDPATGAMWKLEEAVSIPLTRSDLPVPGEGGLTVLSLDQLPQRYHPRLVRVRCWARRSSG